MEDVATEYLQKWNMSSSCRYPTTLKIRVALNAGHEQQELTLRNAMIVSSAKQHVGSVERSLEGGST
jgi:hypothetical protein